MRASSPRLIVPRRAAGCAEGIHTSGSNSPRLMTSSGAGSASGRVRQPAQAGVGPALPDQRELGVEGRFHPDDVHVRGGRRGSQRGGGLDREGIGQPRRHDHAQARPSQACRLPGPVHPVVHERQHGAGRVQQHGAGRGEPQAFAAALQQRRADDLFQPPDLLAQGRLGDEHPLRGVSEAARVGDRDEVTQMPQLDGQRRPCRLGQRYRLRLSVLHARPLVGGVHDHFGSLRPSHDGLLHNRPPGPAEAPLKAPGPHPGQG